MLSLAALITSFTLSFFPILPGFILKQEAQLKIEKFWSGSLKKAIIDGDIKNGSLMAGQSVSMVKEIQTSQEIIFEIIRQSMKQLERIDEII